MSSDVGDELEALLSVWYDIEVTRSETNVILRKRCLPRSNQQFVSVHIELQLPHDYPNKAAVCTVLRSTGLDDDGAQLANDCNRYLQENMNGDPILFQFYEYLHDCLDHCSAGTCLICSDTLAAPTARTASSTHYSVRTECMHCYHLHCLIHWAAISLLNQEKSKDKKQERELENVAFRTLEGQVRMHEKTVQSLQDTLTLLHLEKQRHETSIQEQLNELVKDIDTEILKYQSLLSELTNESKKSKVVKIKSELFDRIESTKSTLADREKQRDRIVLEHKSTKSPSRTALEATTKSIMDTQDKLRRAESQAKQAQQELGVARMQWEERKHLDDKLRWFPCPNCRVNLNNSKCLAENTKYFDDQLSRELELLRSQQQGDHSTAEVKAVTSVFDVGNASASGVASLPVDIQEYVRHVQRYQQTLRESLRGVVNTNTTASVAADMPAVRDKQSVSQDCVQHKSKSSDHSKQQSRDKGKPRK